MKIRDFKGTFFEIGKQQGIIYRKNGLNLDNYKVNDKLLGKQFEAYKKYYPEFLVELDGIVEGGNFDKDKIRSIYLTGEIAWYTNRLGIRQACSIFGVKNDKGLFIGRNLDWIPETAEVMEIYKRVNPNCFNFFGISDMLISSPEDIKNKFLLYDTIDIINEKGLFIGITFAYNDKWSYGLSWKEMTKMIGERCSGVEDALNIFKNVPLSCPKNFFIADKKGDMVVVEHTTKKFKVLYPNKGILIQTNHYVDKELEKEDTVLAYNPKHNTFDRYNTIYCRLNDIKTSFEFSDIIKVLGDNNSCVCQNNKLKTIWALALDMTKDRYVIYTDLQNNRKEQLFNI